MKANVKKSMLVVLLDPSSVNGFWFSKGQAPRRARVSLASTDWSSLWEGGLRSLDDALAEVVTRLRVPVGAPVVVGFESTSSVAEAQSIPAGDAQLGLASLRLAMCERLGVPRRTQAVQVKQVSSATGGDSPSSGVAILSGASESEIGAIHDWIGRAGLRCTHLVPSGAVLLAHTTRAISKSATDQIRIVLHIEGHRSVLGVSAGGRIELLRTFEIGMNNLAEAIARASASRGDGRASVLSVGQALESLAKNGLPKPDTDFDTEHGLSANAVLPVLQPVLQRFGIEIKQSLRMVMRRSGTSAVHVELRGPGSKIPLLPDVFAQAVEVDFQVAEDPAGANSLELMLCQSGWQDLALTSTAAVAEASSRRFRRAVVAGAVVGLGVLGVEAAHYASASAALKDERRTVDAELVQVHEFEELSRATVDLGERLTRGENLLGEFVGSQPDWNAVLTSLAVSARSWVELTEIRGTNEKDHAYLLLYGVADATDGSATNLTAFIEELSGSALFEKVDVESRVLLELNDRAMYQFRLRVALKRLRPELITMEVTP